MKQTVEGYIKIGQFRSLSSCFEIRVGYTASNRIATPCGPHEIVYNRGIVLSGILDPTRTINR